MQIAFWSPYKGQMGTTTATIVYSAMTALMNNYKILLSHSQFTDSTMERCLVPSQKSSRDGVAYFQDHGMDALVRLVRNGRLGPGMFKDYTTSLLDNMNYDLLESDTKKEDQQSKEDIAIMRQTYKRATNEYDMVFVDLPSGMDAPLTSNLLEDSDIVVVCLNQNVHLLERYVEMEETMPILKKKRLIYHLGNYDEKSRYSIKNIKKKYRLEPLMALPYESGLRDACNQSQCLDYLMRHINCKKSDDTCRWIGSIKKNINTLMQMTQSIEQEVLYQHA